RGGRQRPVLLSIRSAVEVRSGGIVLGVELLDEALEVAPGVQLGADGAELWWRWGVAQGGEEGADGSDALLALLLGPGLPAGPGPRPLGLEVGLELLAKLHHLHEEAIGEGAIGVFGGAAEAGEEGLGAALRIDEDPPRVVDLG